MGPELTAALDRLTLVEIAEACGREIEFKSGTEGLCRSPFPEYHDHGDKNMSFTVVPGSGGKGWVNHAGKCRFKQKGGNWDFARECKPSATNGELSSWLIDLAGTRDPKASGQSKAAFARKRQDESAARARRVLAKRAEGLRLPPRAEMWTEMPAFVADRYHEGTAAGLSAVDRLAESRGWPFHWADELIHTAAISRPLLPWVDSGNRRGWAFPVVAPVTNGPSCARLAMGYHQRYTMGKEKSWVFVPYAVADEKTNSAFQHSLWGYRKELGMDAGERMVPPAPFVIGDLNTPRLVIVTEGQWDAVTLYGALGGFEDTPPEGLCVFGVRGVGNAHLMLSYWAGWIRGHMMKSSIKGLWILADADESGQALIHGKALPGKLPQPCFADVVRHNFPDLRVVTGSVQAAPGQKDFNDYYRNETPSIGQMWDLMDRLKLV